MNSFAQTALGLARRVSPRRLPPWCALLFALHAAQAQPAASKEILAGSGTLESGLSIQYNTTVTGPGVLADSIGGGFRIDGDRVLRLLVDKAGRQYLGYQLGIAPAAGAYRVSVEPLAGIEDLLRRFAPDAVLRPAPEPKCPAPQTVREGEGLAFDLMTTPDGRQRVTDTIHLLRRTAAEVTMLDAPVTFKSSSNLVSVPVVVRDAQGRAAANFTKDDFQLSDSGRTQIISRFEVERPGQDSAAGNLPGRFVAYLFDDLHFGYPDDPNYKSGIADMERARDAAWRRIDASLGRDERVALYTTSGQIAIDFTADRQRLRQGLYSLRALGATRGDPHMMSFWAANQMVNSNSIVFVPRGEPGDSPIGGTYNQVMRDRALAQAALDYWNRDTRSALDALDVAVGRLSVMPGRRAIVIVSPGFLLLSDGVEWETSIIDRAIRAGVVLNAVDVKGVYSGNKAIGSDERAVMAELTSGTGGRLLENSNDFNQAFDSAAGTPETIYVLAFVPLNLKMDGRYHALRVTLRNGRGFSLEARRGYYAPRYADTPEEQAKKQIAEAFFSNEETRELSVAVETQFFKSAGAQATVDVLTRLDLRQLRFQKEGGRNKDNVTVVSGLFDRDGNYVTGAQKVIELRLKDETLANRADSGIAVRASFDVKPGAYTVRTVARDSGANTLTAVSAAIDIP
ncbi:MAG TPA: VWA domain-containing protein [Bryobacteraceae bacterium]|nr:VWA domain-containing protein [Bryobacteraceae bacterium]